MQEEQGSVRDHAIDALSKIGLPAAGILIDALSDARPWVRIRASRALVSIQSPDAIPVLFQTLDGDSYLVGYYAQEALTRMGIGQMAYFNPHT